MSDKAPKLIDSGAIDALRSSLRGELLDPAHAGYHEARVVWNAMIDRRPALIVRCRNAADVAAAVSFARDHRLVVAVRSGGHNVAGYAVCDGGVMIDMSHMNAVRLSPSLDRAFVEGGAQWRDVDMATAPFGRATPGGPDVNSLDEDHDPLESQCFDDGGGAEMPFAPE